MHKISSLLIILIFITSCSRQEYEEKLFDLSKLNFNMNVNEFYSKSMNRENIKLWSQKQYVQKDTISEYDIDWSGERNKIFGIQYNVIGYSPKDTVASYENLHFSRLEAMTSETEDLMMVSATGECTNEEFQTFLQKITNEYKSPVVEEKQFSFFKTYHYTWLLNDRLLQLVSETQIDFEQTPHNSFTKEDKKRITDIEKGRTTEIHLFICKLEYEKKLRGKMNTGDWSDFK